MKLGTIEITDIYHSQTVAISEYGNNIETKLAYIDKSKNTLLVADSRNFPVLDFALYLVEERHKPLVIFIQTTMSAADKHNDGTKVENAAGGKDINKLINTQGVAVRILNSLLQKKTSCYVDKSNNTLIFKTDSEETLDVFYVYVSGAPEQEQQRSKLPTNVTVLSREYLVTDWGIVF